MTECGEPTAGRLFVVWLVAVLVLPPPEVRATGLPKLWPSTANCTEPVGAGEVEVLVTVAVKLTGVPKTAGFCDDVTEVEVLAELTTWLGLSDPWLVLKLPSLFEYCAVTVCPDKLAGKVAVAWLIAVLLVGLAPVSGTGVPKGDPSTTNCTEPVGCAVEPAELSVTVAVKVTDWPKIEGFEEETTAVVVLA